MERNEKNKTRRKYAALSSVFVDEPKNNLPTMALSISGQRDLGNCPISAEAPLINAIILKKLQLVNPVIPVGSVRLRVL